MFDVTTKDGVAVVAMTHGKANTMDVEFCAALTAKFNELESAPAQAVVLTGQGAMFSAGVNLLRAADGGADYMREFLPVLNTMFATVFFFPRPVVAAINGHAIAGGCVLACCADRRLLANGTGRMGITELQVGLPFPALALEIMRFALSPRFFSDTVLDAETFPPDDALTCGLADELVDRDGLLGSAVSAARKLASIAPDAYAMTKRRLRQGAIDFIEREGAAVDAAVTDRWTAPDTTARIRDYVARTFKKAS